MNLVRATLHLVAPYVQCTTCGIIQDSATPPSANEELIGPPRRTAPDGAYFTSVSSPNFCFQCSCTKAPPSAPCPKRSGRAGDRLDSNLDLMA